jgi:hypothetical protein
MRIWDVRRAIQAVRSVPRASGMPLWLQSSRVMAGVALYASLFEPDIAGLELSDPPHSHRDGPILLNVQRYLDLPQVVAMAAERSQIVLHQSDSTGWDYPTAVCRQLQWPPERFRAP